MQKILGGWIELIVEFDKEDEVLQYVEQNKGKGYLYYHPMKKEWLPDDDTAFKAKGFSNKKYSINIRKPYGKCKFPKFNTEKWILDMEPFDRDLRNGNYLDGYYACAADIIERLENRIYLEKERSKY